MPRTATSATSVLVAGFSSGLLRCFDGRGRLLLSPRLHPAPVLRIRIAGLQSFRARRWGPDMLVLHQGAVCVVEGFSLSDSLSSRLQAPPDADASAPDSLSWRYHKWLPTQQQIRDAVLIAPADPHEALDAAQSSMPRFLAVGSSPFLVLYRPKEERAHSLTGLALASTFRLATRLTSAVFSYAKSIFGAPARPEGGAEEKLEAAAPLEPDLAFADEGRVGLFLAADPSSRYAVTADAYGRVALVDIAQFLVVRMWKGYRGASVAFVTEKSGLLLLAICAGDAKGAVELWSVGGSCRRIAQQKAGPECWMRSYEKPRRVKPDAAGPSSDALATVVHRDGRLLDVAAVAKEKAAVAVKELKVEEPDAATVQCAQDFDKTLGAHCTAQRAHAGRLMPRGAQGRSPRSCPRTCTGTDPPVGNWRAQPRHRRS